jgi:cytochrome c2
MHINARSPKIPMVLLAAIAAGGSAAYVNGCSSDNQVSGGSDAGPDVGATPDAAGDGSMVDGAATDGVAGDGGLPGTSGPEAGPQALKQNTGTNADNGKTVFRFETFGNEGYWTKILELPQGMIAKGVTPAQALAAGVSIDIDAVPAAMKAVIASQLAAAGTADPTTIAAFQDPATTVALLEANAVIGVVARNVTTLNGTLDINPTDIFAGESVGLSCAFCHSISDGSTLSVPNGGSIGHRVDGPSNHNLQVGKLVALANHSVAFYPTLALDLVANGHESVSRKGPGVGLISATPTEAEIDAYLNDAVLYPVGMFDDQPDGNGAPVHITPFFRQDLAAPYGSEGSIHHVENFSNLVYTALLDPTDLLVTAPASNDPTDAGADAAAFSGPQYLEFEKAGAAGLELIANYKAIVEGTLGIPAYAAGNDGYPYVGRKGDCLPGPAGVENEPSIGGLKCDQTKLLDMNTYLFTLHAPVGTAGDPGMRAAGRAIFRETCTSCHNDDQSVFVPEDIVPFNSTVDLFASAPARPALYPAWAGVLVATRPGAPFAALVPAKDSPGIFDDKLIITEASNYGQPRGDALPLLMDLARKPSFLHDDEVTGATPSVALSLLLDPARGATAPHPFYVMSATDRAAVVVFLQSLDDTPLP